MAIALSSISLGALMVGNGSLPPISIVFSKEHNRVCAPTYHHTFQTQAAVTVLMVWSTCTDYCTLGDKVTYLSPWDLFSVAPISVVLILLMRGLRALFAICSTGTPLSFLAIAPTIPQFAICLKALTWRGAFANDGYMLSPLVMMLRLLPAGASEA